MSSVKRTRALNARLRRVSRCVGHLFLYAACRFLPITRVERLASFGLPEVNLLERVGRWRCHRVASEDRMRQSCSPWVRRMF